MTWMILSILYSGGSSGMITGSRATSPLAQQKLTDSKGNFLALQNMLRATAGNSYDSVGMAGCRTVGKGINVASVTPRV